jgi:hypothetical protein
MSAEGTGIGHEIASAASHGRLVECPVMDTETHTFLRCWPAETSPQASLVDPFTRAPHTGDVLLAEMDRIGVDAAIVIGYDGYDFAEFMRRHGSAPSDFMGGRAYTRAWAARHPTRLHYITTFHDPRRDDAAALLEQELGEIAIGAKFFPAYLRLLPDAPPIREAFDILRAHRAAAAFGFEDINPPQTASLSDCYESLGRLATDYPDVPIQVNHGANAAIDGPEFAPLCEVVAAHPNILVSTSFLGGTMMEWPDGWRFPFPEYRRRLAVYAGRMPPESLAWGTDWPWLDGVAKYPQLLEAVILDGVFAGREQQEAYLGGNAIRHWRIAARGERR